MTRRMWFGAASGLTGGLYGLVQAGAAKISAQTVLSTRGQFLNWSPDEERYWFFSAEDGLERFRRLAYAHPAACGLREIARSATGLPVYALRVGTGPRQIALISGMHGAEPSGPRGLLAYVDALLESRTPFGLAVDRQKILSAVTLYLIPLLNPGGAERFAQHFPDAWHGTWIPEWTEANKTRFFAEGNEPLHFFNGMYVKKPPMRFTPDQIAQWEATGNVLGSSLTDQGLDIWFDWDNTHGAETRGLKDLLGSVRPYCVADFHNFMFPTEVFAPTVYSQGPLAEEERALASALQAAWRAHMLPFHDRPPRSYPKPAEKYYEDYWLHQLGARALIIEANGGMVAPEGAEYEPVPGERALTRRESLQTVFLAAATLVERLL